MCGNVTEVTMMQKKPKPPDILKVDKDTYVYTDTGEIGAYKHTQTRAESTLQLKKTFAALRRIINANATNAKNCLWVTLTYKENMQDHHRLMADHAAFYKRLKRYLIARGEDPPEYIACVEPQGRGAWHMHILYIWQHKAPYIDNMDMYQLWGLGFTKTEGVKDADNLGAYLSVYLTDIETDTDISDDSIKVVDKDGVLKKIKKGGRLKYYPTGIKIFRCSKGIERPDLTDCDYEKEKATYGQVTYQKIYELYDDETEEVKNYICKRYHNKIRGELQDEY